MMGRSWVFLLITIFLVSSSHCDDTAQCGNGEIPKDNPSDCVADCCPTSDDGSCAEPCHPGPCRCSLMSRRDKNGTCISTRDCPPYPCGENEEYDSCPVCSESCNNASPDGRRCRSRFPIRYVVICQPKCRCIDDYWRDSNNNCVPYESCPQAESKNGC